jgi:hypothetical protein
MRDSNFRKSTRVVKTRVMFRPRYSHPAKITGVRKQERKNVKKLV